LALINKMQFKRWLHKHLPYRQHFCWATARGLHIMMARGRSGRRESRQGVASRGGNLRLLYQKVCRLRLSAARNVGPGMCSVCPRAAFGAIVASVAVGLAATGRPGGVRC
jgi:hypothetical protein